MSVKTGIEWTDSTWSPFAGCTPVSPGCKNCYATRTAIRLKGAGTPGFETVVRSTDEGPRWTGDVKVRPDQLGIPLSWKHGRQIFVNSQSDTFHGGFTNDEIAALFGVMAACPRHTFQVLTKRVDRALEWFEWVERELAGRFKVPALIEHAACKAKDGAKYTPLADRLFTAANKAAGKDTWPLPNVWIGASVEDQARASRIATLAKIPAAKRFLSCEPLLGPVDISPWLGDWQTRSSLAWVIVGGESGPSARPMDVAWARGIVAQCQNALVPVFVKQLGAAPYCSTNLETRERRAGWVPVGGEPRYWLWEDWSNGLLSAHAQFDKKGGDPDEWPADLRLREMPPTARPTAQQHKTLIEQEPCQEPIASPPDSPVPRGTSGYIE